MNRRSLLATDRQRGSATLELAILAPALLLLLGLVVLAGRVQVAAGAVEHAASVAARDASLARDPAAARATGTTAAGRELAAQDLRCTPVTVAINTTGFSAPVGQPATVTATITCTVTFADLALPGLPGAHTVTAHAVSPLDTWRTR